MFFSRSRENLFKAKVRRQNEEVGMGGPTNNFCLLPFSFCLFRERSNTLWQASNRRGHAGFRLFAQMT
jgi:hypothetical protein